MDDYAWLCLWWHFFPLWFRNILSNNPMSQCDVALPSYSGAFPWCLGADWTHPLANIAWLALSHSHLCLPAWLLSDNVCMWVMPRCVLGTGETVRIGSAFDPLKPVGPRGGR